jgi:hypothetical protein
VEAASLGDQVHDLADLETCASAMKPAASGRVGFEETLQLPWTESRKKKERTAISRRKAP